MKIINYLPLCNIFLNIPLPDKDTVIKFISDKFYANGIGCDSTRLYNSFIAREQIMSTGVGNGICFPHCTNSKLKSPEIILVSLSAKINYNSIDKLPVDIVFAIIVPEKQKKLHLQILARLSRLCKNQEFINSIKEAKNPDLLLQKIKKIETYLPFH